MPPLRRNDEARRTVISVGLKIFYTIERLSLGIQAQAYGMANIIKSRFLGITRNDLVVVVDDIDAVSDTVIDLAIKTALEITIAVMTT